MWWLGVTLDYLRDARQTIYFWGFGFPPVPWHNTTPVLHTS